MEKQSRTATLMWPNFGYSSLLWIFDGYINVTRVLLQFFFGNVPATIMWPELGYSSLLSKLGNIGFNGHTVQTTISWLLMLWDLWNSIVAVWCRDIYVAKQTHRGGIRAGHPPLWDHLHLGVSSWRMKSRCLTFTLASRLVNNIFDPSVCI